MSRRIAKVHGSSITIMNYKTLKEKKAYEKAFKKWLKRRQKLHEKYDSMTILV